MKNERIMEILKELHDTGDSLISETEFPEICGILRENFQKIQVTFLGTTVLKISKI